MGDIREGFLEDVTFKLRSEGCVGGIQIKL